MSRRTEATFALLFVGLVLLTGLALTFGSRSGGRWSNLGIALVAGVVPGGALLLVQQSFARAIREQSTEHALSASVEPTAGMNDKALPDVRVRENAPPIPPPPRVAGGETQPLIAPHVKPGHYMVQYVGRHRDASRIDAMRADLRVFRDDEYFSSSPQSRPGSISG